MDDIASLGFAVDSSQVVAGTAALDRMAASAKNASNESQRIGQSHTLAATATQRLAREQQLAVAVNRASILAQAELGDKVELLSRATDNAYRSLSTRSFFRLLAREASLAGGPLAQMIGHFGILNVGGQRLGVGVTASTIAIAALTAIAYKAVEAFIALEIQQIKTANALMLTKGASGQTVAGLEELAQLLAANGTQSLTDIRATENELLKFKAVGFSSFSQVMQLAKDLAATGFADLKSGATAIGKALQDPTKAAEALADVGLRLSVAEQRLASDLYAAGKAAQAKAVILKALSTQVSGADASAADTLDAAWRRVTGSSTTLLEVWGKQIVEGLRLKSVLDGIASALPKVDEVQQAAENQATLRELARHNRAGTLVNGALPAKPASSGDTFNLRFDATGIEAASKAVRDLNADMIERKKRIDEVNDSLLVEARTSGMSAVQQQVYTLAVKAGVEGDKEATSAIRAKVNAIASANETRQAVDQIKQQTASQVIEMQTLLMTTGAAAAYRAEQEALVQARIKNITLGPKQIEDIHNEALALGRAAEAAERLRIADHFLSQGISTFAKDIASGMRPADAAIDTLKKLDDMLIDILAKKVAAQALSSLFGGLTETAGTAAGATTAATILTSAGATVGASLVAGATEAAAILGLSVPTAAATLPVAGAVTGTEVAVGGAAAGTALAVGGAAAATAIYGPIAILIALVAAAAALVGFSGNSAEKDRQKKAIQGYRDRAVLAGTDTNTLQGQLTEFDIRARAEQAALPNGGLTQKSWANTLSLGLFGNKGGKPTQELIELQKAQEAERLKVIQDYNAKIVEAEKKAEADRLQVIEDFGRAMNEVKGQGFLNDFSDLFKQIAAYQTAGVGPGQLADFFGLSAQKIVDDADLTGAAFNNLLDIFPQLTGVVHESTKALEQQADEQKRLAEQVRQASDAAAKTILDFVNNLLAGPNSTVSPQDRLTNAQAAYNSKYALALTGNADAQASITQDADNLIKALRDNYASSQAFQDGQTQIISQLLALPAVTTTQDPLLQATRDVLGAINSGNATQARDATLNGVILTAINLGNAPAIAAYLYPKFDTLNTTADGGLDFNEFLAGLGPQYANLANNPSLNANDTNLYNRLGNIFSELDTNGDGQLSRDELLRNQVVGGLTAVDNTTGTKLNQTNANTNASNTQLATANTQLATANATLEQVHTGTDRLTDVVFITGIVKDNTRATANNTAHYDGKFTFVGEGGHAAGGWIHGPGSGTSDTAGLFRLSNGEFVVNAASAAANRSLLESINDNRAPLSNVVAFPLHGGSSDGNAALLSRIEALTTEVVRLQSIMANGAGQITVAVRETSADAVEATDKSTKKTVSAIELTKLNQRAA